MAGQIARRAKESAIQHEPSSGQHQGIVEVLWPGSLERARSSAPADESGEGHRRVRAPSGLPNRALAPHRPPADGARRVHQLLFNLAAQIKSNALIEEWLATVASNVRQIRALTSQCGVSAAADDVSMKISACLIQI